MTTTWHVAPTVAGTAATAPHRRVEVGAEQRGRLAEVAKRTPVTLAVRDRCDYAMRELRRRRRRLR